MSVSTTSAATHNDALDYARRLYQRVPATYRAYDQERGQPLLALLTVIAEQVANVRQDLDALWDDFFIETADDWVVPYLGALVGTNLLPHPVGQTERLDVWNTVLWRRSKGTPAMLRQLGEAISGWPADLAEFFQNLGWSQNLNHPRLDHPLTPDLRDPLALSLLGRARDPFAHAAGFTPAAALDEARLSRGGVGLGTTAWGTPGRYQIKSLGLFVRRLQPFALAGVTPAAAEPGAAIPPDASCFTFDPLFRDAPLFRKATAEPITRADFDAAPWDSFGRDLAVRQFGVLLASEVQPAPVFSRSDMPFSFGGRGAGLALDAVAGLRLLEPGASPGGGAHFVISAVWHGAGPDVTLGSLSTRHAALGDGDAFHPGTAATAAGQLTLTVRTGRAGLSWPGLAPSPAARFPGAVVAVRAARVGPLRADDARYVSLPPTFLTPADTLTCYVADDGSSYATPDLGFASLLRESEGQLYPPRPPSASAEPARAFTVLNRQPGGLRLADPSRFGGGGALFELELFTGAFQPLGALATIDQPAATYPELAVPNPWPAFTAGPSTAAIDGTAAEVGLLTVRVKALGGGFVPASELIVTSRVGESLLVYLPELESPPAEGVRLFVAADGSSYAVPPDQVGQLAALNQGTLSGLPLARASAGQVLPIAGVWPLQQRRSIAIDLCRCERSALLRPGELGVDPERGRFALPAGDPAIQGAIPGDLISAPRGLSVDYVEAFSDRVGARTFDRGLDPAVPPTRLVARSGDARSPLNPGLGSDRIHATVASALAAAEDGDVIEVVDSATYAANAETLIDNAALKRLTLRAAAGQRPCLTFYQAAGAPAAASLHVATPLDVLDLNGLLISGGPLQIDGQVGSLSLLACTLDPLSAALGPVPGSLVATDVDPRDRATYLLCRCIAGPLRTAPGITRLIVADSIVDGRGAVAIGGADADTAAQTVQLERATVLGRVRCDVLNASECLLDELTVVDDQQAGCIRYSRYEPGSTLPRRYQCVPSSDQQQACSPGTRCLAPLFNSRRFGRPDYAQLAPGTPSEILTAGELGGEVGAFSGALNTLRLDNLQVKLREFLPVGLNALVIAET